MVRSVIAALAGATALGIVAGFGGGWWPLLDLVAAFRLHLGVLAVLLALVAALGRHWRLAAVGAGLALLAGASLGPALEAPGPTGSGRPLTVLYGNVNDTNAIPGALAAAVIAREADVLVTSETSRDLAGRLARHYPHRLVAETGGGARRTAIWSRFPLRETRLYPDNTVAPTGASAVVDLGRGLAVGLIGGHFSRPTEAVQPAQVAALRGIAAGLPRPLLVVGDFNAAPWTATLARAARLTETRIAGGYRVTWRGAYETPLGSLPEPWGHQIDHVLVSEEIGVEAIETVPLPGSDHAGLLARLRVPVP